MKRAKTVSWMVATGATVALMVSLVLLIGVAGCSKSQPGQGGNGGSSTVIQNAGSDTMVNLAQMWAEEYGKVDPQVSVEVRGGGSGVGISSLMKGAVDIANASRDMTADEKEQARKNTGKEAVETIVGYDGIAIYVNKDNPIQEMTVEQLAGIYGENPTITKWSQLGVTLPGSDEIVVVSRQNSSGTYAFLREHVLKDKSYRSGMLSMAGSKDVVDLVGKTPGAIGYSGMGYKIDAVKFVKLSAKAGETSYDPTTENVRTKHYPLARSLNMYTLGQPAGETKKFMDWILSPAGQALVDKSGYIPVSAGQGGQK